nr:MAG TPA: hypothetical protein [Caudoviricetes sp.]
MFLKTARVVDCFVYTRCILRSKRPLLILLVVIPP